MRSIQKKVTAQKINMGGIILDQAIPHRGIDQISPFLLIHHWAQHYPGGQQQSKLGVGPHPHRGFAPVTLIFKGSVHHRDSEGFEDIIHAGGTQWMNSGKGIIHSERPGKKIAENGGDFEIIQFWVNSPSAHKMIPASYQPLTAEDTPVIESNDHKFKIGVVAGSLNGKKTNIETTSPLLILRYEAEAGGRVTIPVQKNYNALLYQLDGRITVGGEAAGEKDMLWFNNDGDEIEIVCTESGRGIILAGEPINESVATYGPFVMNTQEEIMKAISDFQSGKMGKLVEKFD